MTPSRHNGSGAGKAWLRRTADAPGALRFLLLALLGAFLVLFVAVIWLSHANREKAQRQEFAAKVQSVGEGVRLRLKGNADYLQLLAQERSEGELTPEAFQQRASQYVRYHPELLNITWVDARFVIREVAPLASNRQILGLRLNLPEPKRVSRLAKERRAPVYTRPFEAIQGMPSFEIWVPVYRDATFIGLFAGVYSCEGLVRQLVSTEQQRFFRVFRGKRL
jgi:sensor domain CHASE-containing protein